jgi:hypothetical protein
LSTYQQSLLNMGQTLDSAVNAAPSSTAASTSYFDPGNLNFQIRPSFHDGFPLTEEPLQESQSMKNSGNAKEGRVEDIDVLGLSSLREETDFYDRLNGKVDSTAAAVSAPEPAPEPAPEENPFWQQNSESVGNSRFSSLRHQFQTAGNVFQKYQHFLRGSAAIQTQHQADAAPKNDESINVDTLLGVAAGSKPNPVMEQEAQVLASSFDPASGDPEKNKEAFLSNIPDTGEMTASEAQRWRDMVHLSHLVRDRIRDDPEEAHAAAAHDDASTATDAFDATQPRPTSSHLWDPESQATEEIQMAHGQLASTYRKPTKDLWASASSDVDYSSGRRGLFVPASKKQWDDVLRQYKSRVSVPFAH